VIDLKPFRGFEIISELPRHGTEGRLFWHSDGEDYKNFASNFAAVVGRVAAFSASQGGDFRPFTISTLSSGSKEGRSIYDLQKRLGHTSIKTTELYIEFLTPEEERIVKEMT
jgi:integrase/recombinase XerD